MMSMMRMVVERRGKGVTCYGVLCFGARGKGVTNNRVLSLEGRGNCGSMRGPFPRPPSSSAALLSDRLPMHPPQTLSQPRTTLLPLRHITPSQLPRISSQSHHPRASALGLLLPPSPPPPNPNFSSQNLLHICFRYIQDAIMISCKYLPSILKQTSNIPNTCINIPHAFL